MSANFLEHHDGLTYRIAILDDADNIAQLCLTDFYPRMPLFRHLGAIEASDVESSLAMLPGLLQQGASLVAIDNKNGQLVGARLSTIEASSIGNDKKGCFKHPLLTDPNLASRYPKHSVVVRLVDTVESQVDWSAIYPDARRALAFRLLVVKATHGGRGVGKRLVEYSLRLAGEQLDIPVAVGSTESRHSQRIYEKLGFKRLASVDYKQYTDAVTGQKPFASLAETTEHNEAVMFARSTRLC